MESLEFRFLGNGIIAPLMVVGLCLGAHISLSDAVISIIVVGAGIIYGALDGLRLLNQDKPIEFGFIGTTLSVAIVVFWRQQSVPLCFQAIVAMWTITYISWLICQHFSHLVERRRTRELAQHLR